MSDASNRPQTADFADLNRRTSLRRVVLSQLPARLRCTRANATADNYICIGESPRRH